MELRAQVLRFACYFCVCTGSFFDIFKLMSLTAAKNLVLKISLNNELQLKYHIY